MKKLLVLIIFLMFSCGTDDDCPYRINDIHEYYGRQLDNDNLSVEEEERLLLEYDQALESPCDFEN